MRIALKSILTNFLNQPIIILPKNYLSIQIDLDRLYLIYDFYINLYSQVRKKQVKSIKSIQIKKLYKNI